MTRSVEERFWEKVDRSDPYGCWPWIGHRDPHGYGILWPKIRAHRLSYELAHGPIEDGLVACHRCDNPPCVNPDHLFLGTPEDNWADMRAKGRGAKPPVHLGEANYRTHLTAEQVREIRRAYAEDGPRHGPWAQRGPSMVQLGERYGVSYRCIGRIVRREVWKHVS